MDLACQAPLSMGMFQARILEWVAIHFLLQGIVSTQESNLGLLHCWQVLYQLSYQGSPTYSGYIFFVHKSERSSLRMRAMLKF